MRGAAGSEGAELWIVWKGSACRLTPEHDAVLHVIIPVYPLITSRTASQGGDGKIPIEENLKVSWHEISLFESKSSALFGHLFMDNPQ
jgi:hypothetical protein